MAAIGPVADLRVLNVNVNPDGFRRRFVAPSALETLSSSTNDFIPPYRAASAGGAVTGPLIVGNRVMLSSFPS